MQSEGERSKVKENENRDLSVKHEKKETTIEGKESKRVERKERKQVSFYARKSEIKRAFYSSGI